MRYHQITSFERYMISRLRKQGFNQSQIATALGRHRSTISREFARNCCNDGCYRPFKASSRARRRKWASRRNRQFTDEQWYFVIALLHLQWSPEQISLWLKAERILSISHATIYRFIWYDAFYNGELYKELRQAGKQRRKRYGRYDSRGVMGGKRHISQRPVSVGNRSRYGHWEGDTVMGASSDSHCIVTLVERKSKYVLIGKLEARTTAELNRKVTELIRREAHKVKTVTVDNGTEFHQYKDIEQATDSSFYFATPYHSWERGLNENTNGLIRQYLPKGKSMLDLTQKQCDDIARRLNTRPRKTLKIKTPEQVYANY